MLENKSVAEDGPGRHVDGWQLVGWVQHSPAGAPAFLHRTMNKMRVDEEPWRCELLTGPLPHR